MSNKTRLGITGTRACRIAAFAAALSWVAGPAAAQVRTGDFRLEVDSLGQASITFLDAAGQAVRRITP